MPGGEVFRAMAVERRMSLPVFGRFATDHPEVDVELDARLADQARRGGVVIESRLAAWIARNEGLLAVTVFIDCPPEVRAARVAGREGVPVAQALADNAERQRVERERYLALYGIDIEDLAVYDLVLDSDALRPDELSDRIVARARHTFA